MVDSSPAFVKDNYGGVQITDLALLPETEQEFDEALTKWIAEWKADGVRSVQVRFKPPKCHLMNPAAKHGFYFHHAKQQEGYVLMILWLDEKVPCRMPPFAHHYLGVGGLCLNEKREIVLIQENRTRDARLWKLPGGFVDGGERLSAASVREVKEESGVEAEFVGILGLREQVKWKYGASDLYVACILMGQAGQEIDVQDKREVKQARWVPL